MEYLFFAIAGIVGGVFGGMGMGGGTLLIPILTIFFVDVYVMTRFTRRILSQVTFMEEMRNLLPILLQAMLMGVLVHFLKYLIYSDLLLIVSGIFVGITLYAGISIVSGSVEIRMLWGEIRKRNR